MSRDWRKLPRDAWHKEMRERFPVFCGPGSNFVNYGLSIWPGWYPILLRGIERIEPLVAALPEDKRPYASQIKQKFGGLCFYTTGAIPNQAIRAIIHETEAEAGAACEECGQPGKITCIDAFYATLCETHRVERIAETPEFDKARMEMLDEALERALKKREIP